MALGTTRRDRPLPTQSGHQAFPNQTSSAAGGRSALSESLGGNIVQTLVAVAVNGTCRTATHKAKRKY